jgi:hypothetical protein
MSVPAPLFESRPRSVVNAPGRRLLLLTYHFPPDGAVGGLRWEKMSRFFSADGWGVDVVMRDVAKLRSPDMRRLEQLPPDVRVYSATETEPWLARMESGMLQIARSLRAHSRTTAPAPATDAAVAGRNAPSRAAKKRWLVHAHAAVVRVERERAWGRAAVELSARLGRANHYDVVVSSGPPHMVHDAARTVARRLHVPHVMDLRDPWSAFELEHGDSTSRLWFAIARRYERRAVQSASLIVMNTDLARDEMRRLYPDAAERIVTVSNGSDDEPIPAVETNGRFVVRFAGSIYLDRNPGPFFRAAAAVARRRSLRPEQFGAEFIGEVEEFAGQSVRAMAEREGFGEYLTLGGARPRDDALRFAAGATMLLNLPQATHQCVPAKLFEYARFNSWLLVLAAPHSATAQLFRGTTADVVAPDDVAGMSDVIERRYLEFVAGRRPQAIGSDGRFDRSRQAKILSEHLSRIVAG